MGPLSTQRFLCLIAWLALVVAATHALSFDPDRTMYLSFSPRCSTFSKDLDTLWVFGSVNSTWSTFLMVKNVSGAPYWTTTQTAVNLVGCLGMARVQNSIIMPFSTAGILEFDDTTLLQVNKRVAQYKDGATTYIARASAFDASRNRLHVLNTATGGLAVVVSYQVQVANSGSWQVLTQASLAPFGTACTGTLSRQMAIGPKYGYVSCSSSPTLVRWSLDTLPMALDGSLPIGLGDSPTVFYDRDYSRLFFYNSELAIAYFYDVDETNSIYSLRSVFRADPLNAPSTGAGVIIDPVSNVIIYPSFVKQPSEIRYSYYLASGRPDKFNSAIRVLAAPPPHPSNPTGFLTPMSTYPGNAYSFGNRGYAVIPMQDVTIAPGTPFRGAISFMLFSNCSSYGNNCSACLGSADPFCHWALKPSGASPDVVDGVCSEMRNSNGTFYEQDVCPELTSIVPQSGSVYGRTPIRANGVALSGLDLRLRFYPVANLSSFVDSTLTTLDPARTLASAQTPAVPSEGAYVVEVVRQSATNGSGPLYHYVEQQPFTFYNCSQYTTCDTCARAERSECGWCSYDARCISTRDKCATADSPFLAYDSTNPHSGCPSITALTPGSSLSVPLPGVQLRVALTGIFTPPAFITPGMQCVFLFASPIFVPGTVDAASGELVCDIPTPPVVQPVEVQVYFRGLPFSSNTKTFVYYFCSLYTTCSDCLSTSKELCGWCAATSTCQLSNATCSDSETNQCPSILSIAPPSAYDGASVTVNVTGGPFTLSGSYQCRFGSTDVPATRISSTELSCSAPVQTGFPSSYDVPFTVLRNGATYVEVSSSFRYYKCLGDSCSTCLGELQPLCGFCVTTGTCGLTSGLTGCPASKLNTCPTLASISPIGSTPSGDLPVIVKGDYLSSLAYSCVFSLSATVNVSVDATFIDGTSISCMVPNVTELITATTQAAVTVFVNQTVQSGPDVVVPYSTNSVPFRFVVCSEQSSCASCSVAPQCSWCDLRTCVDRSVTPSCSTGIEYNSSFTCPSIYSISPDHAQVDSNVPITIVGRNFISSADETFYCNWDSYFFTQATVLNSTHVQCQYRVPRGITPPPLQPLGVSIISSRFTPLAPTTLSFDIFNCTMTSDNCTHCLSNPSPYCGWCIESYECMASDSCSSGRTWLADVCPTISSVSPNFGLIQGGSQVLLQGSFYVSSESESLPIECAFDGVVSSGVVQNSSFVSCDVPEVANPRTSRVSLVQGGAYRSFADNTVAYDRIRCVATSCGQCFTPPDSDTRCTWCPYEQACTTVEHCSIANPLVSAPSSCPDVLKVAPSISPLEGGATVFVTGTLFVNHPNLTCAFGDSMVPATFINSTTISCVSPVTSNGSQLVDFQVRLNGNNYATTQLLFEYKDIPPPIDPNNLVGGGGIGGGFVALIVLLILFALAAVAGVWFFLYVRRRTEDERNNRAFLKLRTPDFDKFAVAVPKELDFEISSKDEAKLIKLESFLLNDTKYSVVYALSKIITDRELDVLAKSMTWFFTCHKQSLEMMLHFLTQEIEVADSEGTLFRSTSAAAKIFNQYARYVGIPYLWTHLGYYVNLLHEFGKETRKTERDDILGPGTMEVDPDRVDELDEPISEVDLRLNQLELLVRASKMLKSVLKSVDHLPPEFRILCKHVKSRIAVKFPGNNADYKAVGGFLFLRYICPSIMTPHVYGLLEEPPNDISQRYFVLIAKLLQSLANEAMPGAKEDYMTQLNEFVTKNIPAIHHWADSVVSISDESLRSVPPQVSDRLKNQSLAYIAHLLADYMEQLYSVKELDKSKYDELDDLLQQIGAPGKLKENKDKKKGAKKPLKGKERDI